MKRRLILLLAVISLSLKANAQLTLNESFNYAASSTNGLTTQSANVWKKINSGDSVYVSSNSLCYEGFATPTGNKIVFDGGGSDYYTSYTAQTTGTVYASFLLNVSSLGALDVNGGYFTGFLEANSTSAFGGAVWTKASAVAGKYNIGISNRSNSTPNYVASDLNPGQTYLVVISYEIVTGTANDITRMWINPTLGGTPATADATGSGGTDLSAAGIGRFFVRQDAANKTPFVQIDEIKVGTNWADVTPACTQATTWYIDADNDGYGDAATSQQTCCQPIGYVANNLDCDDANALVNPTTIWYADLDHDGFGDAGNFQTACIQPQDFVLDSTDCDDNNSIAHLITTWYQDLDNDTYGNGGVSVQNCGQPTGYVSNSGDCDDSNNAINPGATEIADNIDNNCNNAIDEGFTPITYYLDADNDSFGGDSSVVSITNPGSNFVLITGDCDDNNNAIHPNATEICDGIDNNCNNAIDENLAVLTYYIDVDNDGYGNALDSLVSCSQPNGYVLNNTDCNDANNAIHPGAADIQGNGIDEDCTGADAPIVPVQLGIYQFTQASACPVTATSVTTQPTNATFGNFSSANVTCSPAANVFSNADWNLTPTIDLNEYNEFSISAADCHYLKLTKLAFNHRCSATGGTPNWIIRSSLDNYSSNIGTGVSGNNNNVNLSDTVNLIAPLDSVHSVTFRIYITGIGQTGSTWRMDNVSLYGNVFSITPSTYYADADGDGFGDIANDSLACTIPTGFVIDNTDCNDTDSLVHPGTVWYMDMDQDGFGDATMSTVSCTQPTGYVLNGTDCNDNNNAITGSIMYYTDADNDGYGDFATGALHCADPGNGYVTNSTDCDDTNPAVHPGATEICDGIDNDCVGGIDNGLTFVTYYTDADNDGFGTGAGQSLCQNPGAGFVTVNGDCNDTNPAINPNSPEICDNVDNNCNNQTDENLLYVNYFVDADNDGFGTGAAQILCQNPGAGFATQGGDCNDNNAAINPNATDIEGNAIDENCDGVDGNLGVENNTLANVSIVPNPSNGQFVINGNFTSSDVITMEDLNGKQVFKTTATSNSVSVNLALPAGIYLVKVNSNQMVMVQRVVIR